MPPTKGVLMEKLFNMTEKDLSLHNLISKVEEKGVTQVKAAEILGVSDRHFRRLLKAYRDQGPVSLLSRRKGKPSNSRIKDSIREKIVEKLKTTYAECGPTFAWEKLVKIEKIEVSVETVRKIMMKEGLWVSRKRKHLKVYQQRSRREHEGELIQMDGSPHAWFEDRAPKCCLLAFIDDATSKIKYLKFVEAENTINYLITLREYMERHGKPLGYYSDRFSVFRVNNDKEGYRKLGLTEVGRALKELGVELICANSPQAKGRVERLFQTLQDRLVKEIRLRGISSIGEGNKYLEEYSQEHNNFFSVSAVKSEDLHRGITTQELDNAFCYKAERRLTKNLEISYSGRVLQVQVKELGYALRGAKVVVTESLKGQIKIMYQGKELEYKELLVKDHQGQVKNKKEILLGSPSPMRGRVA
jgi:transposase